MAGDGGIAGSLRTPFHPDSPDDLVLNFMEEPSTLRSPLQKTKRNRKTKEFHQTVQASPQSDEKAVIKEEKWKRTKQESCKEVPVDEKLVSLVDFKEKRRKTKKEVASGEEFGEPCEVQNGDASKQSKKKKKKKVKVSDVFMEEPELGGEEAANFLSSKEKKRRRMKEEKVHKEIDGILHEIDDEGEHHQVSKQKRKKTSKLSVSDHSTMHYTVATEEKPLPAASPPTVSIAVAGSIIDNAQTLELAVVLAGQIARAATIFRIDEIVVFDDDDGAKKLRMNSNMQNEDGLEKDASFMVRILEYLEVPQYLRKALIPWDNSFRSVGMLPPLDAPHHLRRHEWFPYREGVVVDDSALSRSFSYVDVGLQKNVKINQSFEPRTRVTVAMGQTETENALQVVDREVVQQTGTYWGYRVRYASCLSAVFDECPFEGKYDYSVGTSEHGERVRPVELVIPKFKHLLIAFGGVAGLEESLELDKNLEGQNTNSLFDRYLNTCPNQGSRTIRTEEAILISLQYLQEAIQRGRDSP